MNITIVGTGYVGLVTGACFADVGNNVFCVDIDKDKISALNNGEIPIFEEKLDIIVKNSIKANRIRFSTDIRDSLDLSEIIFLAVSTPMNDDGNAKLDYILSAAKDIGRYINDYKVIVVKSTVPVGTTIAIEEVIRKEISKRGLEIEFDIANNPEFLKEGMAIDDFVNPDRIIIGLKNQKNKQIFRELYKPFSRDEQKLVFLDIPSSELTKYAANAMLAMKISFINEISQLCEEVNANINDVKIGIGSDTRIGNNFINPSIGFGGSCFPKDVNSLKVQFENVGLKSLLSDATLKINKIQGERFAERVLEYFREIDKNNICFAAWGITFKPGTDDIRESQAIKIIDILTKEGFKVNIFDPEGMENAQKYYLSNCNVNFYNDKYDALKDASALLLLTEWKEFRSPNFLQMKELIKNPLIFDGRNIYNSKKLHSLGFKYFQIGVKD